MDSAWPELTEALRAWGTKHGNPWASRELRKLAQGGHVAAERFARNLGSQRWLGTPTG